MPDIFTRVQWRHANAISWNNVFDIFFPPKGHELPASTEAF